MPELPEVETVRRELARLLKGRRIAKVEVRRPQVVQGEPGEFAAALEGRSVRALLRRGKLLLVELSGGKTLAVHLKMTGQLVYGERSERSEKSRVVIRFTDGTELAYNDQRLFGRLEAVDDWEAMPFVSSLGPEPFHLTPRKFREMLRGRRTRIKPLLLDQHFVAGIGNIYACEALFRARVDPAKPAEKLSDAQGEKLFREIVSVLREAISCKGSSLDQYVRARGNKGTYGKYHRVYGKTGTQCRCCRTRIVRKAIGGRGTYYCPSCQR